MTKLGENNMQRNKNDEQNDIHNDTQQVAEKIICEKIAKS